MSTARELFLNYCQALNERDVPAAAALFAEDGFLDYPSLPSIGVAPNVVRREAIPATPTHRGRRIHVWDAAVTLDDATKPLALFRCTQLIV